MEGKKYKITVTLLDNTTLVAYANYDWYNYTEKLNDTRNKFIDIQGMSVNKDSIKTIIPTENVEEREEEKIC